MDILSIFSSLFEVIKNVSICGTRVRKSTLKAVLEIVGFVMGERCCFSDQRGVIWYYGNLW